MEKTIKKVDELKQLVKELKKQNKKIGLVPTMGYLHEGHLSLLKESVKDNDISIMSIYVNPTQFSPDEDLDKYPRDIKRDTQLAFENGCDILFVPSNEEMYPEGYNTYIDVGKITQVLCGKTRKGHFRGVCTVVAKLFNITSPNRAYFGQKDYQQYLVIKKMVDDLNMNLDIVRCPIVREKDGLAKSSRNKYLSIEERKNATVIYKALQTAENMIKAGENNPRLIEKMIINNINYVKGTDIEYVEVRDAKDLSKIDIIDREIIVAVAVWFNSTRLIDNFLVEGEKRL